MQTESSAARTKAAKMTAAARTHSLSRRSTKFKMQKSRMTTTIVIILLAFDHFAKLEAHATEEIFQKRSLIASSLLMNSNLPTAKQAPSLRGKDPNKLIVKRHSFSNSADSSRDVIQNDNLDADLNDSILFSNSNNSLESNKNQQAGSGFASLAKRKFLKTTPSMLNSAVINGKVSLPCDISPANSDDSVALILWYKDDSLAPIYTIDARKANSLDKAKISLDDAYANRATFDMKSKPAHLVLEPIKQDDEGEYRCRVDFKKGRTVNTIIGLKVVEPPKDIGIYTLAGNRKLQGLSGPFDEGSELNLNCITFGGKPRPQIIWKQDFNTIDETYQHLDKEGTSNELKIPSLSKNHRLSVFTCQASNNNLTSPLQTFVTLDINLKPQEISLKQLGQEPLVVGQTATFECTTHGSIPQATIYWMFQGTRHDPPMNVDHQQQTSSRLSLTLQRSFNQQMLICFAQNPRILSSANSIQQTIKLDVHYPPQLSIKLELPPSAALKHQQDELLLNESISNQLQEGNDIYLTCQLDSNPRPLKPILWRFNGKLLSASQQQQQNMLIVMNNQSLVLRKVSRFQSGSYSCEAVNVHGSNSSRSLEIVIKHAPVCATDDILVYQAVVGQTISLDCNVIANPSKSNHFSWFLAKNERNQSHWFQRDAGQDEQIDESSSRLKYKIRDENSFGYFKCKAKNEIGLQQRVCLFQIIPAQLMLSLKHSCNLSNTTATTFQIACQLNEHLKSEEFELTQQQHQYPRNDNSFRPSGGLNNWLSLEALRAGGSQAPSDLPWGSTAMTGTGQMEPSSRIVFPPNWLLAELYKMPADSSGDPELAAYIIVSAAHQLANIKSIVEDSKLFSSQPKIVYYVATKTTGNNSSSGSPADSGANPTGVIVHQQNRLTSGPIEEPSIQLANNFAFTVPSLEPEQKYKLLIFGQNLANKTRDWIMIKGETLNDERSSSRISLGDQPSRNNELIESPKVDGRQSSDLTALGGNSQQQKSIVMRSDNNNVSNNLIGEGSQDPEVGGSKQSEFSAIVGNGNLAKLMDFKQFNLYKDYAISYAKQKPLMALPILLLVIVTLSIILVYLFSLFIGFIRSGSGRPRRRRRSSRGQDSTTSGEAEKRNSISKDNQDSGNNNKSVYMTSSSSNQMDDMNSFNSQSTNSQLEVIHSSLANSSNSPAINLNNSSSTIPLIQQQQQQHQHQIYSISDQNSALIGHAVELQVNEDLEHHSNQLAKLYPVNCHLLAHGNNTGSLDRRETMFHQQQPIYLTDTSNLIPLTHHNAFNSIDRRQITNGGHNKRHQQQHLMITNLNQQPAEQHAIYLASPDSQQLELNLHPLGFDNNANFKCGSVSSSIDCSSDCQQHYHRRRQDNQHLNPSGVLKAKGRTQRVAFDLSNQQSSSSTSSANKFMLDESHNQCEHRHIVLSPIMTPDPSQQICNLHRQHEFDLIQQQRQLQQGNNSQLTANKATSDSSGGSNSGNTADSGHESPLHTNNETLENMNGGQYHKQLASQQGGQFILSASSSSSPIDYQQQQLIQQNGKARVKATNSLNGCCYKQQTDMNNNLLMELSPGSQESSTLLQSVDSSSFCTNESILLNNQQHLALQKNHQMATSFTSQVNKK